jgi:Ca-activated chloride channel family protein
MLNRILYALGLICLCIVCALAASDDVWTDNLQQGQATIHQTQLDDYTEFTLVSPPSAQFEVYATDIASTGPQSCPSEAVIREEALYNSDTTLTLPRGEWCIEVYAASGNGTYTLYVAAPQSDFLSSVLNSLIRSISPEYEEEYTYSEKTLGYEGRPEEVLLHAAVEMALFDSAPAPGVNSGGLNSFDRFANLDQFNTEEFNAINDRGFVSPLVEPLSTFASSVDTASYSLVRAKLSKGERVSPDMVRIEEFINYFTYDYPQPTDGVPLASSAELGYCPWAEDHLLLQVGVQAEKIDMSSAPPSNLVFLIDVSGSMQSSDKLGLVRQSFMLLTENLRDIDRVSIVTYAGSEATLLDGVSGEDKAKIMSVIESLEAGGITNGAGGIEAAYNCAERNFITGGINRVILATDGDFNVGITSAGDLSDLIAEKRETGVFLSVLGYGMGNYKDNKMETLAKDGNGNAYYIDSLLEARRVLVEQMGATLNTVAKDVKLQVEFNPSGVKAYRLIGYENRMLNAEDFNDDSVHAGAIGSGHSVTALYEIIPAESDEEIPGINLKYQERSTTPSDELLNIAVRYKLPDGDESSLIEHPVTLAELSQIPSDNMLWASAVAEFALSLRESTFSPEASILGALELARSAGYRSDPYRVELIEMAEFLSKSADL